MSGSGTATSAAVGELARVLGVDDQAIVAKSADWLRLMQEGIIVRLHVRRWRAKARLELADLGLPHEVGALAGGLLELGEKRLLSAELLRELDSLESAGRKALEKCGYQTYWGTLVPAGNFAAWQALNQDYADRYLALGRRIADEFAELRTALLAEYATAGALAYQRMTRLAPEQMSAAERWDEAFFVAEFTGRIERLIPDQEYVAASFEWAPEFTYIPLPALLAADQAAAERVRAERRLAEAAEELAHDKLQADRRIDAERERLAHDTVWATAKLEDGALKARQAALVAMNAEVVAQARAQREALVGGFLRDVVSQLRGMVYDAATDVLASLERHGGALHPKSAAQIKNLFDRVASLNFYGDAEVTAVAETLRAAVAGQDTAALRAKLADVATVMRSSLLALGDTPRSAARLGIADVAPDAELGAARRRLALVDDAAAAPVELPAPRRAGVLL